MADNEHVTKVWLFVQGKREPIEYIAEGLDINSQNLEYVCIKDDKGVCLLSEEYHRENKKTDTEL